MPLHILKKKRSKLISVRISTFDADLEFSVDQVAKVKHVFDLICHTIGLRETWYFGLAYTDSNNKQNWLKLDKKILDQNILKSDDGFILLKFHAKFYPEVLEEELIQEVTRHMFFLQFQQQIASEELVCQPEACILLASYAIQAKFGDYDPDVHKPGFLVDEISLPQYVQNEFQTMTGSMWEEQISNCYAQHHGLTRDEAELEYLKIVQDLEMCGVNYFNIKDINGTEMWLGVDAKSVCLFAKSNKMNPIRSYQWSELSDMSYSGNKFIIKQTTLPTLGGGTLGRIRPNIMSSTTHIDNVCEEISFFTDDPDTSKLILDLCKGNHDLFMQRRRVDSLEIQQMKAQAREEKARKQGERNRLKREKDLRLQAQQDKSELEEKFKQLQDENNVLMDSLRKSEDANELLSEKTKLSSEESMLLSLKVGQSDSEIQKLKAEINKLQENNHHLTQRLHKYDQIMQQLSEASRDCEAENERLKEETHNLKKALAMTNKKMMQSTSNNIAQHHSPNASNNLSHNGYALPVNQPLAHNQVHAVNQSAHASSISMPTNVPQSNTNPFCVYSPSSSISGVPEGGNVSNRNSNDFSTTGCVDVQQLSQEIEKERVEYQVKTRNIEKQLQSLHTELEFLKYDEQGVASFPSNSGPQVPEQQIYLPRNEAQMRTQY
uniref:Merlin-like n=1 Tax=Phallusia mammillata TaxID=59560 RepID=A0A6F9DT35_9ASCI|nr:merlin-like [Phallusia mammillata]